MVFFVIISKFFALDNKHAYIFSEKHLSNFIAISDCYSWISREFWRKKFAAGKQFFINTLSFFISEKVVALHLFLDSSLVPIFPICRKPVWNIHSRAYPVNCIIIQ